MLYILLISVTQMLHHITIQLHVLAAQSDWQLG